jgi:hypothetical protein
LVGVDPEDVLTPGREGLGITRIRLVVLGRRQDAREEGDATDGAFEAGNLHGV